MILFLSALANRKKRGNKRKEIGPVREHAGTLVARGEI
jgi:hypothetical protein